jgi:hypothetical protein
MNRKSSFKSKRFIAISLKKSKRSQCSHFKKASNALYRERKRQRVVQAQQHLQQAVAAKL